MATAAYHCREKKSKNTTCFVIGFPNVQLFDRDANHFLGHAQISSPLWERGLGEIFSGSLREQIPHDPHFFKGDVNPKPDVNRSSSSDSQSYFGQD
jgi:hypothetical protein